MINDKPEETAKILVAEGFPVERYEEVQAHRRTRLRTFEEHNVMTLIKAEEELIAFGEEVLRLMREAYAKH